MKSWKILLVYLNRKYSKTGVHRTARDITIYLYLVNYQLTNVVIFVGQLGILLPNLSQEHDERQSHQATPRRSATPFSNGQTNTKDSNCRGIFAILTAVEFFQLPWNFCYSNCRGIFVIPTAVESLLFQLPWNFYQLLLWNFCSIYTVSFLLLYIEF